MGKLIAGNLYERLSLQFIGSREEFSMQHRAFHAIAVFTFFMFIAGCVLNLFQGVMELALIIFCGILVLIFLYIQSRKYGRFRLGLILYSMVGYIILFLNYYYNSGIIGPTFFLFFMSFQLLVAISPLKIHWLWVLLHVTLAFGLLIWEYYYPEWTQQTYPSRESYFLDIGSTFLMAMIIIYIITSYLLKNYNIARQQAESSALEIKQQHAYLENLNIEKDKILAIISHDLRSPLASIQSFLEILNKTSLNDSTRDEINQQLLAQTKNTSEMLGNLLAWSQSQLKGGNIDLKPLSVIDTLDLAYTLHSENAKNKGVNLHIIAPETLYVMADQEMLQVVLRNLLNNAIKFTPEGGTIQLNAMENEKGVEIIIRDNGVGIQEHKKQEIFSLNIKATQGTHNEKGIGLGLLLCKEYVERQHGSIRFESDPDSGTTFYIQLPRANGIVPVQVVLA
jgi:two-component system sensor histidine kinase/response regulator